jgi:hypothetical protein
VNDTSKINEVRKLIENVPGVQEVWGENEKKQHHLNHSRAGELVAIADNHSWFTYYYWLDDAKAPDFAPIVDIHKKPGYDPVELFMTSKARAGYKLLRKKAGLRYVMDVIPLDATLVKGSHGCINPEKEYYPILITDKAQADDLQPTDIHDIIWEHLNAPIVRGTVF